MEEQNIKYFVFENLNYTLKGIYTDLQQALDATPRDGYHDLRQGYWEDGPLPNWHDLERISSIVELLKEANVKTD